MTDLNLPTYYTVAEIAEMLSLSPYTIREWCKSGKIKGIKIGRDWRISRDALKEYVNSVYGGEK